MDSKNRVDLFKQDLKERCEAIKEDIDRSISLKEQESNNSQFCYEKYSECDSLDIFGTSNNVKEHSFHHSHLHHHDDGGKFDLHFTNDFIH